MGSEKKGTRKCDIVLQSVKSANSGSVQFDHVSSWLDCRYGSHLGWVPGLRGMLFREVPPCNHMGTSSGPYFSCHSGGSFLILLQFLKQSFGHLDKWRLQRSNRARGTKTTSEG